MASFVHSKIKSLGNLHEIRESNCRNLIAEDLLEGECKGHAKKFSDVSFHFRSNLQGVTASVYWRNHINGSFWSNGIS